MSLNMRGKSTPGVRKGIRNEKEVQNQNRIAAVVAGRVLLHSLRYRLHRRTVRAGGAHRIGGDGMAQVCVNGARECDGCGYCYEHRSGERIGLCEHCSDPIYEADSYYDIDGTLIHWDCLREWAAQYLK